jgi:2-polyprenyl-3-methyl-5-hydroxy-6-metoxy-1,4-benzoquinol methylase
MHLNFYKKNQAYAENLRDSDPRKFQALPQMCASQSFYRKYERALRDGEIANPVILDVGCGVGQVVRSLTEAGFAARGVEVSEANLAVAREHAGQFDLYDGTTLPLVDQSVDAVGAFNVLEHVENPIGLLDEMTRVLRPGGRIVLSSPNFLRVLGWRDYHPHMRSLAQKWRNAKTLLRHKRVYAANPQTVLFEKMAPIQREQFQPDDDAITATTAIDFHHYLTARNYEKIRVSCVDRPLPRWIEALLDCTPLRFIILNSFVVAHKPRLR